MQNPFEKALQGFQVGPDTSPKDVETPASSAALVSHEAVSDTYADGEHSIEAKKKHELMDVFGQARALFEYAEKELDESAGHLYYLSTNPDGKENPRAIELPQRFYSLLDGYPGKYFIVDRENRLGSYNKEGTRSRSVTLSTVRSRADSDEKQREIFIQQPDPRVQAGNILLF